MPWVLPVAEWKGYKPVVSQGYKPGHDGVDVMFRRDGREGGTAAFPIGEGSTKNFFMPDGVGVHAVADGVLWFAGKADTGHSVIVDHDEPSIVTLYLHLARLDVPEVKGGAGRIRITAGQRLGTVGASPLDAEAVKHLHFEVWKGGGHESHVDPAPYLAGAVPPTSWTRLVLLFGGLFALFGLVKRKGGAAV